MADYISRWKGPSIDAGIDEALNGIGCRKFMDCSVGNPLDLNRFHDEFPVSATKKVNTYGAWVIEHYVNGPFVSATGTSIEFSPILVTVSQIGNKNYQSVNFDDVTYYRYANKGEDFTNSWNTVTEVRFVDDVSDVENLIKVSDPKVKLHDNLCLAIRLKTKLGDQAKIQFNENAAIPLKMSDGTAYRKNHIAGSYIVLVFSSNDNYFYVISEGGRSDILEDISDAVTTINNTIEKIQQELSKKADAVVPELVKNPGTKVTVNGEGIVTRVEAARASDIMFDDSTTLENWLTQNNTEIKNDMISFEGLKSIPSDWGDIT